VSSWWAGGQRVAGGNRNGRQAPVVGICAFIVVALLSGLLSASARAAFSAPFDISDAGRNTNKRPEVASDAGGNAVTVWSQYDSGILRVQARQISSAGTLGPVQTLSAQKGDASVSQIASDAHGDAVAAWLQSFRRIKARQISAGGALGPVKTLSPPRRKARRPQIASDAGGDAVAVWAQYRPSGTGSGAGPGGTSWRVKARQISAGGVLGPVKPLSAAGRKILGPQIASDADGDAVAVWSRYGPARKGRRIKARKISAGGALGPVRTLSATGPKLRGEPQIASDADGDAVAVWSRYNGTSSRVKARQISAAGALGRVKMLSAAVQYPVTPQIASDAGGDAVAVWSPDIDDLPDGRVQARRISAAGAVGPVQTLSPADDRFGVCCASSAQIASDADGDAVAVWSRDFNDLMQGRVQARQISATGALGPVQTLSAADGSGACCASSAQIASGADGDAVAVWSRFDGATLRVQGSLGP
jgi:hypothetical protein